MKLKPCPFCGSKEMFIDIKGVDGRVGCVKCRALGPRSVYYGDAAENAWNTRPSETQKQPAPTVE